MSANEAGLDTNDLVLRKIVGLAAAVIADQARNLSCNLRHLRASAAADSHQRTRARDDAKAWRLTVMKEGAGWRMHYWQVPDPAGGSIIEFANVLKKQDPEHIYED